MNAGFMSFDGISTEAIRMHTQRLAGRLRNVFAWPCAGPDCPQRGKVWPAWLHRRAGIHFDGHWYCGGFCLASALQKYIHNLLAGFVPERPKTYRHPIGTLLVNRGVITSETLRTALNLQSETAPRRLGRLLQELQLLDEEQLVSALSQQWGCPVYPLEHRQAQPACIGLLPTPLMESTHAVPAHLSSDGTALHLAFADHLDHTMLYAVGVMLGCRTFPCIAGESAVVQVLGHLRRDSAGHGVCFDTIRDPREISRTISSYAAQLRASRVAMVRVAGYLWVRLYRVASGRNLLFRLFPETSSASSGRAGDAKQNQILADSRKVGVS